MARARRRPARDHYLLHVRRSAGAAGADRGREYDTRFTTQRQDVERNVAVYTDRTTAGRSITSGAQLLYAYKLNPQTVLYLGAANSGLEDDRTIDVMPTNRTLFAKFSYAWLR